MNYFTVIEGRHVILLRNGVYKQAKAYKRGNELYAGQSGGFVRLLGGRGTSDPNTLWIETDVDHKLGEMGRPVPR